MRNYFCKLRLSSFLDSRIIDIECDETGRLERGIFIPIDKNDLVVTKTNKVIAKLWVLRRKFTGDGNTHHLKPAYSKAHREKIENLGFSVPYLATMKPTKEFNAPQKRYNTPTYNEEDDV